MKICTRIANSETCDISSVQTGSVCKEFIGRFDFPNIAKYKLFDTYTFPLIRDIPYIKTLFIVLGEKTPAS